MGLTEYIKTNRKRFLLVIFLITLTQAATTLYTYLTSPQLTAISQGKFSLFLILLLAQFIIGQICNVSFNLSSVQNTKQTQALFHQVRKRMLRHYYQNPDKVSTIENRLTQDLQLLQDDYFERLFYFACDFIRVLFTIAALFTFHWILVAYSLVITILAICVPKLSEKYSNRATESVSIANKSLLHVLEKWFSGLAELRRFENKTVLKKVVGQASRELEKREYQKNRTMSYLTLISGGFDALGRVGVPIIAGILFYHHQVSLGAILAAGYFANDIFYTLSISINIYAQLQSTKALRNKLAALQTIEPETSLTNIDQIDQIEIHDLKVKYQNSQMITYPDLVVKKGEHILLTGDSGSGKSTLLQAMLGQVKTASGEIIYRNQAGKKIQPNLNQIGYLAQDLVMFPGSIKENITMFNQGLNTKVDAVLKKGQFKKDVQRFNQGADLVIDPENNLLSGGQKQKVVLMRSLIRNKSVLFLDEATSAIDQQATSQILQEVLNTNATIIMIAHNLTPAQKAMFDREIRLEASHA